MLFLFYRNFLQKYSGRFLLLLNNFKFDRFCTFSRNIEICEYSVMCIFVCFIHGTSFANQSFVLWRRNSDDNVPVFVKRS